MSTRYTATIGFRILLAFFCIFVVLIIQSTFAFYSSRQIVEVQRQALTNQLNLLAVRENLSQVRVKMFILLGTLNPTTMETLKAEIEKLLKDLMEKSTALQIPREVLVKSQQTYQDIMELHWGFRTTQAYELINSTSEEEYESLYKTFVTLSRDIDTAMQETIRQANRQFVVVTIGLCGVGVLIVALWGWYLSRSIAGPIKQLSTVARIFATGNFQQEVTVRSRDEVGVLANSFREMTTYIREVAEIADTISYGDLQVHVTPRSEQDTLNTSLGRMITYIQEVGEIAEQISNDELQIAVTPKSEQDVLNHSLRKMISNLQAMMAEVQQQNWLMTGQAELSTSMRGEQKLAALSKNIITYLAKYLQAQVGTMYLAETQNGESTLKLTGSYAFNKRRGLRNEFKLGDGLIGQAALEQQNILYTDVPEGYIAIMSGLGETTPCNILITPFMYEGELKGVLELGTTHKFAERHLRFLEQVRENIAISVNSAQAREKMQELLEASQQQAEELQAQQEQLRVNNEELEAQTDALRQSEQKLQAQQEELHQTNEALAERSQALEQQQRNLQDKNLELENARKLVEAKARELALSSRYKSEFLANMSHELRTPLNSLLILSKLLSDNKSENLTEKQVEFAQTIHAAGSELLELINEVLDLSKVEAGKMMLNIEAMSVKGFVSYIEQNFRHVAEKKGLRLQIEVADGLPASIRTDRQRVEQIIKNLLSNAMKFTDTGEVRVQIERPATGLSLSQSRLQPHQAIAIAVSDTGIGIPHDKQRLIFEAFQQADGTTNRKFGGTGLGLSIVREFTKLLSGEIHLHSEAGQGSTFTLVLPEIFQHETNSEEQETPARELDTGADAVQSREHDLTSSESPIPQLSPFVTSSGINAIRDDRHEIIAPTDKTLLIIEDDPKFAKILFDLARERGFKELIAGDGAAGLQLAYQYLPSAIILDIGLPGMNGWTVMEKLKQNPDTRHIPVHFISASDQSLNAMKMGAIGYLTKPVSIDTLNEAFQTIEASISKSIKKLLIVEDDDATRNSMLELLGGEDVTITTAETGEDAQRLLSTETFDCLVLDLSLKDISGFELLERLHVEAILSHVPVIIYTAKDLTKDEETQLKKYAESIILKGVTSPERLLDEVTLFLHRVEADLPEAQQQKLRVLHDKEAVLSGKTLLIVDDDIRNVFALSSVFEERDMQVLVGENGKEALEQLEQHPEIDIVVMDIMMPEMDGYEAMRRIRNQPKFRNLPIIALTAKAMKGDRQRCIEVGANDYLSKPVDTNKLLSLLRVWLY